MRATARDGTSFALTVPAGALARDVAVTLTPLRSLSGLPGKELAGVRMAPSGTTFAADAKLTIRRRRASSRPLAALHGTSSGAGAKWVASARRGRTITLPIPHFSDAAMDAVDAAGYSQLLGSLANVASFTEDEVRAAVDALSDYELLSPGSCNRQDRLCSEAKTALARRLDELALDALNFDYGEIAHLKRLEELRGRLGVEGDYNNFKGAVLLGLIERVAPLARSVPHELNPDALSQLVGQQTTYFDYDHDGGVSHLERTYALWFSAISILSVDAEEAAAAVLRDALNRQREDGAARCLTDEPAGLARLRSGREPALGFEDAQLAAYDTAIAICRTGVTVSPAEITLAPGEIYDFSAASRPGEAVDWSANAGTIDAAGTYTAPAAIGEYTVTATSRTGPSRQGTARINVRLSLMADWTSQQGGLSASASVSTPGGETPTYSGTCESLLVPAQGSSFDGTRDCTGSGSWGTARSVFSAGFSRTPAGNAFRVIEMHANVTSTASWSSDGAVLHRFNSGLRHRCHHHLFRAGPRYAVPAHRIARQVDVRARR